MADGRIIIDTEINSGGAEKGISGLGGKLSSIASTGLKAFTSMITGAGVAIGGLGAIGVKYNAEMEQYMSSFTTMLGSADKATNHLNDLKEFAAKTPFELGDLAQASTTLQAFGTDVQDITPTLKMLGDISLGNKEKFNGLALVFGQVKSQGKLMGQDLMQMINNGFNPLQIISEKTGKSMSQLKDEMAKGQISFEMVADAMKIATSEGGKFYNAMEGQSKTLVGQWSTLKDNARALLGDMFKSVSDTLTNKVLPAINKVVEKLQESFTNGNLKDGINKIAEGFGNLVTKLAELISDWLPKVIEGLAWIMDHSSEISAGIVAIGTALMTLNVANMISKVTGVLKALYLEIATGTPIVEAFNIVLGLNPFVLIGIAIAGLVAGIVVLWNTNEGFRNAVIGAWNSIKESGKAVWEWLVNFFTVDIPNAFNAVKDWFNGLPDWFGSLWSKVTAKFQEWGNNITNFFTETIPTWIDQIFNWFNELPYKVGYALGYALGTIVKWGVDTWDYLVTNVPIWIENVVKFFSELPGKIWTWLSNTISKIVTWGNNTYNSMVTAVTNAINAVINWFATLPSRIWEWLCNTISKVAQFASDLGSKASQAGSNMVSNIISAVSNLPSKMLDIGSNIVKGVWNGIAGMGSWIKDKVSGFFTGIVDGAKAALGIHSPSRVFRDQVGAMIPAGVAVGIEKNIDLVEDATNNMVKALTPDSNVINKTTNLTSELGKRITDINKAIADDIENVKKKSAENQLTASFKAAKEIEELNKKTNENIRLTECKTNDKIINIVQRAADKKRDLTTNEVREIEKNKSELSAKILNLQTQETKKIEDIKSKEYEKIKAIREKEVEELSKIDGKVAKERLSAVESFISNKKKLEELSAFDEVKIWEFAVQSFMEGTEEKRLAELKFRDSKLAVYKELKSIDDDYTKKVQDSNKKMIDGIEELNKKYQSAVDGRAKSLYSFMGLFDEVKKKEAVSGEQLINNLQVQTLVFKDWVNNIQTLANRGLDKGLLAELQAMGPSAANNIAALNTLTDKQLSEYVLLWQEKSNLARIQAEKELTGMKDDTNKKIEELQNQTNLQLDKLKCEWVKKIMEVRIGTKDQFDIMNSDMPSIGENLIEGIKSGLTNMAPNLLDKARSIAENVKETLSSAFEINSNLVTKMQATVDYETSKTSRVITAKNNNIGNSTITNNNDNGVTQNININQPVKSPSETARALKKVGRDLALGY